MTSRGSKTGGSASQSADGTPSSEGVTQEPEDEEHSSEQTRKAEVVSRPPPSVPGLDDVAVEAAEILSDGKGCSLSAMVTWVRESRHCDALSADDMSFKAALAIGVKEVSDPIPSGIIDEISGRKAREDRCSGGRLSPVGVTLCAVFSVALKQSFLALCASS